MTCLVWANALFCRNSTQRSRNCLDLVLAAFCIKLVKTESTPKQNVCRAEEEKSEEKQDKERNRRSRLTARGLLLQKAAKDWVRTIASSLIRQAFPDLSPSFGFDSYCMLVRLNFSAGMSRIYLRELGIEEQDLGRINHYNALSCWSGRPNF